MRNAKGTLVGKFKGRDHLKDINLNGKIILVWILKKQGAKSWIGFHRLRLTFYEPDCGFSDSIKGGELLDNLSDCHCLKKEMGCNGIDLRNEVLTYGTLYLVTNLKRATRVLFKLTHSWSRALLEKPPIVQLLENFPAFYGTRRFITAFT
jgi:hypothetical protein